LKIGLGLAGGGGKDGPKRHGKVFEDDGEPVTLWHEVEDTLMKYKSSFCD
jgi:hypothetical protein